MLQPLYEPNKGTVNCFLKTQESLRTTRKRTACSRPAGQYQPITLPSPGATFSKLLRKSYEVFSS